MCARARVHEHVRACGADVVVPVSARAAEARAVPPQASGASAGQWLDSGSVPVGREQHVQAHYSKLKAFDCNFWDPLRPRRG